jgi:hypothetical protein
VVSWVRRKDLTKYPSCVLPESLVPERPKLRLDPDAPTATLKKKFHGRRSGAAKESGG